MTEQPNPQDQAKKKVLPPKVEQLSFKEYEELRKKELEKHKKKKKLPQPLRMLGLIISFLFAAFALFMIGFFAFSLLTAPAK